MRLSVTWKTVLATAYLFFALFELLVTNWFPDTMLLLVEVQASPPIALSTSFALPILTLVFCIATYLNQKFGVIGLLFISTIYFVLHGWAIANLLLVEIWFSEGQLVTPSILDLKVIGGFFLFLFIIIFCSVQLRKEQG